VENEQLARYWIGESRLDRFVLRALKRFAGANVEDVHRQACQMLREERVVSEFQILPDETSIWCALQRLVSRGSATKYAHALGVRYKASPMK
jgi:hypothetical protein